MHVRRRRNADIQKVLDALTGLTYQRVAITIYRHGRAIAAIWGILIPDGAAGKYSVAATITPPLPTAQMNLSPDQIARIAAWSPDLVIFQVDGVWIKIERVSELEQT